MHPKHVRDADLLLRTAVHRPVGHRREDDMRGGATYSGTLRRLGGSRKRAVTLRRLPTLEGVAFTVLDCAKC